MNEGKMGSGDGKDEATWAQRNTSPESAGVEGIKSRQKQQLDKFERWAASGDWRQFHDSHYDWWMFPIDRDSRGGGLKWTVYAGDVAELKQDKNYLHDYLRGVELLMASWGWSLNDEDFIRAPEPDQRWQGWPIRLHKAATSLRLFGLEKEFGSLRKYAQVLLQRGENFNDGYDLSRLFQDAE